MKHSKKSAFKPALSYGPVHLTHYMAVMEQQRQLLDLVRSAVPQELALHIVHTLLSDLRLVVYTHSANWASQIRFYDELILNKLQASGQQKIRKLQVKLLMNETIQDSARHACLPSAETIDNLFGNLAQNRDDELAQALSRLGHILKKKQQERDGHILANDQTHLTYRK